MASQLGVVSCTVGCSIFFLHVFSFCTTNWFANGFWLICVICTAISHSSWLPSSQAHSPEDGWGICDGQQWAGHRGGGVLDVRALLPGRLTHTRADQIFSSSWFCGCMRMTMMIMIWSWLMFPCVLVFVPAARGGTWRSQSWPAQFSRLCCEHTAWNYTTTQQHSCQPGTLHVS